ncbi:MAG TPA: alpha/beta hydrolase [Solirubrobacteraceae bacterium]
MPLDHRGTAPGTVDLALMRLHAPGPPRPAILALSGGPGESATAGSRDWARRTRAARGLYDLVVFDQRGTGRSAPLSCPIRRLTVPEVQACATTLGPRRRFFSTDQTVEDVEAVRQALGGRPLLLAGVSYGTYVALQYARAHPDGVERVLLDSTFGPRAFDPFYRDIMRAAPRVLADICARDACADVTPDAAADLSAVAAQLEAGPRSLVVATGRGRREIEVDAGDLLVLVYLSSEDEHLRARLPALLHAAAGGDYLPLARYAAFGRFDAATGADENLATFVAVTCQDASFPWPEAAAAPVRADALVAYLGDRLTGAGPFGPSAARRRGAGWCLGWPEAGPRPEPGPLPPLRGLVLAGRYDVRTSEETASDLVVAAPGLSLLVDGRAGHDVLGQPSACTLRAVERFWRDAPLPACPSAPGLVGRIAPALPRTLADVGGSDPVGAAIRLTFASLLERDQSGPIAGHDRVEFAGLRGGYVRHRLAPAGRRDRFEVHAFRFVEDVAVSGAFTADPFLRRFPDGVLRVSGAVRGTLRIRGSRASGTLNGARYRVRLPAAPDGD